VKNASVNELSKKYEKLRTSHGYKTCAALSTAIKLDYREISNYENGTREMPRKSLVAYSDFFNVSTDYLLGLVDEPPKDPTMRVVCETTGLSEHAVRTLIALKEINKQHVLDSIICSASAMKLTRTIENISGMKALIRQKNEFRESMDEAMKKLSDIAERNFIEGRNDESADSSNDAILGVFTMTLSYEEWLILYQTEARSMFDKLIDEITNDWSGEDGEH
jgi:Helix-turn-helix.